MIYLTKEQRKALCKVWCRLERATPESVPDSFPSYRAFRRTLQPGPDCVMVRFAGMWLGIEKDGYTHS